MSLSSIVRHVSTVASVDTVKSYFAPARPDGTHKTRGEGEMLSAMLSVAPLIGPTAAVMFGAHLNKKDAGTGLALVGRRLELTGAAQLLGLGALLAVGVSPETAIFAPMTLALPSVVRGYCVSHAREA